MKLFCPSQIRFAFAWSGLCAVAVAACLTSPPPDIPAPPLHRPTILHDGVIPETLGKPLTEWPAQDTFLVPVEVDDANATFYYNVFEDYDPITETGLKFSGSVSTTPSTVNGGIYQVTFNLEPPDPTFCHLIEFIVAHQFNTRSAHTPDSVGGDVVSWWYTGPADCPAYDAGTLQYGATDAAADALVVSPNPL